MFSKIYKNNKFILKEILYYSLYLRELGSYKESKAELQRQKYINKSI
jgi:hypothetical protein